jgi:hypothetical protein
MQSGGARVAASHTHCSVSSMSVGASGCTRPTVMLGSLPVLVVNDSEPTLMQSY